MADVPPGIFQKLPEWCVYIPLPDAWYAGVFVHIDCNMVKNRDELRVVFVKPGATGVNDSDFYSMTADLSQKDIMSGVQSSIKDTMLAFERQGFGVEIQIPGEALNRICSTHK